MVQRVNLTWAIKGTYTYDVKAAGHNHNGNMPKLKTTEPALTPNEQPYYERPSPFYLPTTGSLYNNTTYYYREMMPEFSNILTEETQFLGSCTGTTKDILFVKISGLVELSTGTGYILVGKTEYHPYNHFVKETVRQKLIDIAKEFKKIYPTYGDLKYNDFSLLWGGLFHIGPIPGCTYDYNSDGKPEPCQFWNIPHSTHRYGFNADVSYFLSDNTNLLQNPEIFNSLEKIFINNGARILREETHWHLDFTLKNSKYYEEELKCY